MNFEAQLRAIKGRAELHTFVDELPDDAKGVFLVQLPVENPETQGNAQFHHYGGITMAEAIFLTRMFEHWLLSVDDE